MVHMVLNILEGLSSLNSDHAVLFSTRNVCSLTFVRSNGWETNVARHEAAPPNQKGDCIDADFLMIAVLEDGMLMGVVECAVDGATTSIVLDKDEEEKETQIVWGI